VAPGHVTHVVTCVPGAHQIVEGHQRVDLGHGDQVAPAEPSDLAFHASFFMGPDHAGSAEEGFKTVWSTHTSIRSPSAESSTRLTSHGDSRPNTWRYSSVSRMTTFCRLRVAQAKKSPLGTRKRQFFRRPTGGAHRLLRCSGR